MYTIEYYLKTIFQIEWLVEYNNIIIHILYAVFSLSSYLCINGQICILLKLINIEIKKLNTLMDEEWLSLIVLS